MAIAPSPVYFIKVGRGDRIIFSVVLNKSLTGSSNAQSKTRMRFETYLLKDLNDNRLAEDTGDIDTRPIHRSSFLPTIFGAAMVLK
jgi:hypothetical protein